MNLKKLKENWDALGNSDPYWAIITRPDKANGGWEEDEFFTTGERRAKRVVNKVRRLIPDFSFSSVLDFGCGVGRVTQGFANYFDTAVGVDIAPSMIDLATQKNRQGSKCQYILNETDDLAILADESFDLVFSVITLQHMRPRYAKRYVREFLRVVRPDGLIIFQMPSRPDQGTRLYHHQLNSWRRKLRASLQPRSHQKPIMEMHWISLSKMVAFVSAHGGRIHRIERDDNAGPAWDSYTYYLARARSQLQ